MLIQIIAFLGTLALSCILTVHVRDFALARGWMDMPVGGRHLHLRPVPRLGGVAIFISFVTVTAISLLVAPTFKVPIPITASDLTPIFGPALLIFLLGLYDDFFGGNPYLKFGIQIAAAVWLYMGGVAIHRLDMFVNGQVLRTMIALPLSIFWILLITNAFNLIDGLDGLTAGSALFAAIILCVQSLLVGNFSIAFLAVVLAGAVLGFLRYNFHPASIFLGDCGSLFIGFLISALALVGSQKSTIMVAVAIPVISCGLPIVDVGLAVLRRYLNNKPLFSPDKEHIHHKLLQLGFSQSNAVLILYATSAGFALLSLSLFHGGATMGLVIALMAVGVYFGLHRLHYDEFIELHRLLRQIFRQKKIIGNNLMVRRAAELLKSCEDIDEICDLLTDTLRPLGFSGFALRLNSATTLPDLLPAGLGSSDEREFGCYWAVSPSGAPGWELKLALTSSVGEDVGTLTLLRSQDAGSVLLDINVFIAGFQNALGDALQKQFVRLQGSVSR